MLWRKRETDAEAMELTTMHQDEEKQDALITISEVSASEDAHTLSKEEKLILLALASLSLMAALDGTSISVALPV